MRKIARRLFGSGLIMGLSGLAWTEATAQQYPTHPITMMVSYAAGGPSDVTARVVAQSMAKTLGQPIVIENVVGAAGTAAPTRLSRSEPDGHTILIHHISLVTSALLFPKLAYDPSDFQTIGLVNSGPMILATRKGYPASTPADLIARLKADGSKTTIGHGGIGTNAHLGQLLLEQALGVKFTGVPYRGTGPAMNDLVGGQIDLLFDQSTTALPQVTSNTIQAVATTSERRLAGAPTIPTFGQIGLPSVEFTLWHGLYAPKGTPQAVVDRLNVALRAALDDTAVKDRFAAFGTEMFPEADRTPAAHRQRFVKEFDLWRKVFTQAGNLIGNVAPQ